MSDYLNHPEYLALLETVRTFPDDDAPRGIIADWIQDHGDDDRAEAIRWFLANPDYRQSNPIQEAVPGWPEGDRFRGIPCCAVSRGFVSEVRCTAAAFLGGPCGRCNTSGKTYRCRGCHTEWKSNPATTAYPHESWSLADSVHNTPGRCCDNGEMHVEEVECNHCSGTGTLPGLARRLFEGHPITRVVLTDLRPENDGGYWSFDDPATGSFETISYVIDRTHRTEAAALAALSSACVSYGRTLAGLPPPGEGRGTG